MRRLGTLFSLLLSLIPGLALAQVPTYTLVDLGAANVPNGTGWPDAGCHASAAGTDSQGHPLYFCNTWEWEALGTQQSIRASVGYSLVSANQPQPMENYINCCGSAPPPYYGLNVLPLPAALQTFPAEAISISEGGQYAVGYATHPDQYGDPVRSAIVWNYEVASELPALSGAGIQYDSAAFSANEAGEVVGESLIPLTAGGAAERATLWIAGSAHELQYMLAPYVPVILTTAKWIDCAGNIGAQGWPIGQGPVPFSTNYPHNYLLLRQGAARNCTY